jgi:GMP synthase (glutamine-hydrolysing)
VSVPRITVLRPDDAVGLDRFADWMGLEAEVTDLWERPVPALDDCGAALIVLGGRPNALDESRPWQLPLRGLIREAVDAGRPVLGICLGHQVLARSLGGEVTVAEPRGGEHGARRVQWAPAALRDPVFGAVAARGRATVAMSHYDVVTKLPAGAVPLASTEKYGNQAFRLGSAVGVQFHPEAPPERMAQWAGNRGHDSEAMLEQMRAVDHEVAATGELIARSFAAVVARH